MGVKGATVKGVNREEGKGGDGMAVDSASNPVGGFEPVVERGARRRLTVSEALADGKGRRSYGAAFVLDKLVAESWDCHSGRGREAVRRLAKRLDLLDEFDAVVDGVEVES